MELPENITCGYCDCSEFGNLKNSPRRTVRQFEIEFYLADGLTTIVNKTTYPVLQHHILIAKPNQLRYSFLPFQTQYLKFKVEGVLAEQLLAAPDYFRSSHPERIQKLLDDIILLNESSERNEINFYSKILAVLNLILNDSKIPESQSGDSYGIAASAKRYIENHFSQPLRLCDIAKSVGLSSTYFHNLFTSATGTTPHQYLINCRISNAKKMLWDTEIGLVEIAEKSGFGNQQYLNKIFKKETGFTPGMYRKNFQNNYDL